jgi:hypothetical protein
MTLARYRVVHKAIKRHPLFKDTDTLSASYLIRLPMGVNGKPGPKAQWSVRTRALGRRYALEDLQPLFGPFDAVPDGFPDMDATPGVATNTSRSPNMFSGHRPSNM